MKIRNVARFDLVKANNTVTFNINSPDKISTIVWFSGVSSEIRISGDGILYNEGRIYFNSSMYIDYTYINYTTYWSMTVIPNIERYSLSVFGY